jgi:hypothetical protein
MIDRAETWVVLPERWTGNCRGVVDDTASRLWNPPLPTEGKMCYNAPNKSLSSGYKEDTFLNSIRVRDDEMSLK